MGRPREKNVSKWALWKRAERDLPKVTKCSRCGKPALGKAGVRHHKGAKTDNTKTQALCRSCHAIVDNPMKQAVSQRVSD